ncbi:MAG TPA: preprotein translocase subunit SecG [Burkholderiaceae bacterium]|nr:preprotein translocase subunit SecG [Burkholderiaceae bacterium]
MQWLSPVLLAIQVVSSLSIIVLVLLQQGKGADMGSSFGGGSAGSLFGATGAANFLSRTTKWAAIIFFASTAGLAYVAHHPAGKSILEGGIMQGFTPSPVPAAPGGSAVPTAPGAAPAAPGANSAVPGAAVPAAPAAAQEPSAPAADAVPSAPAAPAGEQSGSTPATSTDKK